MIVGRIGQQLLYLATPEHERRLPLGTARRLCKNQGKVFDDGSEPLTACDLTRWVEWQNGLWKSRQLFPPELYSVIPEPLIAHAGGALPDDGRSTLKQRTYTNSAEALNYNYSRGHRLFEIDFSWTTDGELVLLHDWRPYFHQHHPGKPVPGPLTEAEFFEYPFGFTPLDLDALAGWMKGHRDAYIITDVKAKNIHALTEIQRRLPQLQRRFIPQIYHPDEYQAVRNLGYRDLILTLYRLRIGDKDIIDFARTHPLFAVTMPLRQAQTSLAPRLREHGVFVYTHTVNRTRRWKELHRRSHIDGIYTDVLAPSGFVVQ